MKFDYFHFLTLEDNYNREILSVSDFGSKKRVCLEYRLRLFHAVPKGFTRFGEDTYSTTFDNYQFYFDNDEDFYLNDDIINNPPKGLYLSKFGSIVNEIGGKDSSKPYLLWKADVCVSGDFGSWSFIIVPVVNSRNALDFSDNWLYWPHLMISVSDRKFKFKLLIPSSKHFTIHKPRFDLEFRGFRYKDQCFWLPVSWIENRLNVYVPIQDLDEIVASPDEFLWESFTIAP